MTRVLAVCVGNMCRSPLTERLLAARAEAAGVDVTVNSAGTRAVEGTAMHPKSADQLTRLGASASGFRATLLTPDLAREADLILTATAEVRTDVLREAPFAMRRTFTVLEFAALAAQAPADEVDLIAWAAKNRHRVAGTEVDLEDPIHQEVEVHQAVADRIAEAVDQIVAALA